jgi:hypothetical protein
MVLVGELPRHAVKRLAVTKTFGEERALYEALSEVQSYFSR